MREKEAPAEIRLHSYGSKAIIREMDDGTWSVGLLISPANAIFEFTQPTKKEAKDFADRELSRYHSCCSLCGNWEIFKGNASGKLEFDPLPLN